jgi:hypothetical protein
MRAAFVPWKPCPPADAASAGLAPAVAVPEAALNAELDDADFLSAGPATAGCAATGAAAALSAECAAAAASSAGHATVTVDATAAIAVAGTAPAT